MSRPDFQPALVGPTVTLRPISAEDWPELFAAGSDPQNLESSPGAGLLHRARVPKIFRRCGQLEDGLCVRRSRDRRADGSSRYHGYAPELGEIEIGWTLVVRSHWGGATNREVKRLMLDHAFTFVDTAIFRVGDTNWRSQGAMTKIGGVKRNGLFTRESTDDKAYFISEITRSRYEQGGRALVG